LMATLSMGWRLLDMICREERDEPALTMRAAGNTRIFP
jgi:hypothetical protein